MQWADFRIDLADERLWRGDETVHLSNRAFQLLRLFVDNANRLLTKDQILEGLWGDVWVSEGLVKEYVHDLRLALDDDPRNPRFIETVHGRGYRFLGGIDVENADPEPAAATAEPEPPFMLVLPFENMSGDPSQEFIADGLTEDVITELARFRSFRVIARNTAFAFKGQAISADFIAQTLGVRYVISGSVHQSGERIRIKAQLAETETGRQIWAEQYDRQFTDFFALQNDITRTIAAAIQPEVGHIELRRLWMKSPDNLTSWEWYHRGLWSMYKDTKEGNAAALAYLNRAIDASPGFGAAYATSANVLCHDMIDGHTQVTDEALDSARKLAERAVALDVKSPMAHVALGKIYLLRCAHDDSVAELKTAVTLSPSFADAFHGLGFSFVMSGQPEIGLEKFEAAIQLSPYDPRVSSFYEMQAWALIVMGKDHEALKSARTAVRSSNAQYWAYATLCAALGHLGRLDEVKTAKRELLKHRPDFSISFVRKSVYYNKVSAHLDRYVDGLRKAGVGE